MVRDLITIRPSTGLTLLGASIFVGLLIPLGPPIVALAVFGVACLVCGLLLLPPHLRTTVPLCLLLLVPADYVPAISGDYRGFFVLGAVALLCATAPHLRRPGLFLRRNWDLLLYPAVVLLATAVHWEAGQLRVLLYWAAAVLLLVWLHGARDKLGGGAAILDALVLAGLASGTVAVLEFLRLIDILAFPTLYEPVPSMFTESLGARSVGLSGRPLRLGTLTMLSGLISTSYLLFGGRTRLAVPVHGVSAVVSLAALLASGARGAWAGFVLAFAAGSLHGRVSRRMVRVSGFVLVAVLLGAVTGLNTIVSERLFGTAFSPRSIQQRIDALEVATTAWQHSPVIGNGPGGVSALVYREGLVTPNLENEYLAALLSSGLVGLLALLGLVLRRLLASWRQDNPAPWDPTFMLVLALVLNIGTYNMFSWSAGACLFFTVCALATLDRPERSTDGSVK